MKILLLSLAVFIAIPAFADIVTLYPDKDAFVCDCQPNVTNPSLGPQYLAQGQYSNCYNRLFIQFDISSLDPDETINSALLRFYCANFYGYTHGDMLYSRLIEDWDENTVTFNNQPDYTTDGQIITGWANAGSWHEVDVTDIVTGWYNGTEDNFGVIGHCQGTSSTCDCAFLSSRYSGITYDPRLVIDYTGSGAGIDTESLGTIKAGWK